MAGRFMTGRSSRRGLLQQAVGVLLLTVAPAVAVQATQTPLADAPQSCPVPGITHLRSIGNVSAPKGTADLNSVIATVEAALDCYQSHRGVGADALPPLQEADFDFKTTTGKVGGLSVSFFVFKIGASSEKDTTNDLTFSYALPKQPKGGGDATAHRAQPPQPLADAIVADIQSAAAAVKDQAKVGELAFSKLKISLQFGVIFDGTASVNAPVQLVTLGGNGEYKKNETQSVTLTFGSG